MFWTSLWDHPQRHYSCSNITAITCKFLNLKGSVICMLQFALKLILSRVFFWWAVNFHWLWCLAMNIITRPDWDNNMFISTVMFWLDRRLPELIGNQNTRPKYMLHDQGPRDSYQPQSWEIMVLVASVCPSVCMHSYGWTVWPTALIFWHRGRPQPWLDWDYRSRS